MASIPEHWYDSAFAVLWIAVAVFMVLTIGHVMFYGTTPGDSLFWWLTLAAWAALYGLMIRHV